MVQKSNQFQGIESEAALSIFKCAPTPYLVLAPDFTILDANEARLAVTNSTRESTIGRNLFVVFPDNPDDLNANGVSNLRSSLETVLKTKTAHRMAIQKYDIPINSEGGVKFEERYWCPVNFPVLDKEGTVKYIIHQVEDVTEEVKSKKHVAEIEVIAKAIELERSRLLSIFDQAPIGICLMKGPELIIEFANRAYRKIAGEKRKLDGLPLNQAFPDVDPENLAYSYNTYRAGKTQIREDLRVMADWNLSGKPYEKIFFIIWEPLLGSNMEPEGLITLVYDDTEKIRARLEAKRLLNDLHRERDLRERFVATLTHDLRTPLTAAKMSAQLFARNVKDFENARAYADKTIRSLERCDQMILNLLDANRIKAGEKLALDLSKCSLKKVVEETLDELTFLHGDRFSLSLPSGYLEGMWSCSGIQRIIENLCSNAIKYGSKEDKISVSIEEIRDAVIITVQNWGSLISPENQKYLFDPYSRAGSGAEGEEKGWGLGLTLVKGITEAHHGTVTVESSQKNGTKFIITLPIADSLFAKK